MSCCLGASLWSTKPLRGLIGWVMNIMLEGSNPPVVEKKNERKKREKEEEEQHHVCSVAILLSISTDKGSIT